MNVQKLAQKYESARNKLKSAAEKGDRAIHLGLTTVATGGMAYALGYANERYGENGEFKLAGKVPADFTAAAAFHLVALGMGKYADVGHALGNGAIAEYLSRQGRVRGAASKAAHATTGAVGAQFYGPWNPAAMGHAPSLGHAPSMGWSASGVGSHVPAGGWGPGY